MLDGGASLLKILRFSYALVALGAIACQRFEREDNMHIESDVSCAACTIEMDSMATLNGYEPSRMINVTARDASGNYFLVGEERVLQVFGRDGRLLRQIGNIGAGPGEYERIRNVLAAADGLVHVLDAQLARHSWFSLDGTFVGSRVVPALVGGISLPAVLLADGRLVVNSQVIDAGDDVKHGVVKVLEKDVVSPRSIDFGDFDPRKPWRNRRLLWPRKDGGLLVGDPYLFKILVLDDSLAVTDSIWRLAEWTPPAYPEETSDGVFDRAFTPHINSMWEENGLLWLVMLVPSKEWTPGPSAKGVSMSPEQRARLKARPRFESVVEVIDLAERKVVARLRTTESIGEPFSGGYVIRRRERSEGDEAVVFRLSIQRP